VKARTLIVGLAAAGVIPPLASVATAIETTAPQPLQSGPRIIQVPAPPAAEPKRPASESQKKPEKAKPPLAQSPASPSLRAPAAPKANRKIWI
jgi:hypothetical protein